MLQPAVAPAAPEQRSNVEEGWKKGPASLNSSVHGLLHNGGRGAETTGVRATQGGSDVITKTALKRIHWSSYKINQSSDKVGVFVSIVSTKIPFKGAGKEYIGAARRPGCTWCPRSVLTAHLQAEAPLAVTINQCFAAAGAFRCHAPSLVSRSCCSGRH